MARPHGRREQMRAAGALCACGSHDVRFNGWAPYKQDRRPMFTCGSCGSEWTSGSRGDPYIDFVNPDTPWPGPEPDSEWATTPGERRQWASDVAKGRDMRRRRRAAEKRRRALKQK